MVVANDVISRLFAASRPFFRALYSLCVCYARVNPTALLLLRKRKIYTYLGNIALKVVPTLRHARTLTSYAHIRTYASYVAETGKLCAFLTYSI